MKNKQNVKYGNHKPDPKPLEITKWDFKETFDEGNHEMADEFQQALRKNRVLPTYTSDSWDPGISIYRKIGKGHIGIFLAEQDMIPVNQCKNPDDKGSLGYAGTFATVSTKAKAKSGTLILKFDGDKLGFIARASLRLFRYEKSLQRFAIVPRSGVGADADYVWGRIDRDGLYALIGINTHPLAQHTLHMMRNAQPLMKAIGPEQQQLLRNRLCSVILCPSFFNESHFKPELLEKLDFMGSSFGYAMPKKAKANLTQWPLGNLCDICLGLPPIPPELDIPPGPTPPSDCSTIQWESIGPRDRAAEIIDLTFDPSDNNRLLSVAAFAGVWALNDVRSYPATSWAPLNDSLLPLSMSTIAIAPSNSAVMYAAGGERTRTYYFNQSNLYKSTDEGLSWNLLVADTYFRIRKLLVDSTSENVVYVASDRGFFKSVDGGVSWEPPSFTSAVRDIVMDPQNSQILFLCTNNHIYKSTSAGAMSSWTLLFETPPPPLPDISNPFSGRIALGYRNSDGSLQGEDDRTVVFFSNQQIYINNNGGLNTEAGWVFRGTLDIFRPFAIDIRLEEMCLAIDPFDPNVVLAGSQRLFRTDDGGATWSQEESLDPGSYFKILFEQEERGIVYVATHEGVYRSTDGGETWIEEGTGISEQISTASNLNLNLVTGRSDIAVQNNRAVGSRIEHYIRMSTTDNIAGGRWKSVGSRSGLYRPFADPKRTGRFYLDNPTIDGGFWAFQYPNELFLFGEFDIGVSFSEPHLPIAIDERPESNMILIGGAYDGIRRTQQADRTPIRQSDGTWTNVPEWELVHESRTIGAIAFSKSVPGKAYAVSSSARHVFMTENAASDDDWNLISEIGGPAYHLSVNLGSDGTDHLYVASGHIMHRSTDGGRTWQPMGGTIGGFVGFHTIVPHPRDREILFACGNAGVFISYDEGRRWSTFDTGLPRVPLFNMKYDNGFLYLSTYYRGVWRYRIC